jgi:hypothetical protein
VTTEILSPETLSSVYMEGKSVPLQTLVGHMLFPGDGVAQKVYEAYWRNRTFTEFYSSILDPVEALKPPAKPSVGAKGAPIGWDDEPDPKRYRKTERPDEALRRFAQSVAPLEMLTKLPPANMGDRISHGISSGMLVGFCLLSYFALDTNNFATKAGLRAEPSKNIVMRMCEDHNLGRKKSGRGRPREGHVQRYPTVTEGLASANWQRGRKVAHLWAAFLLLTDFSFSLDDPTSLTEERITCAASHRGFIELAMDLEQFILDFFDGQKHGRVSRENLVPLHVERQDSVAIGKRLPPKLPENVRRILQALAVQYQSE